MLKIVVFDYGYGGEIFADQLKEEVPITEIIRVIDWRHAKELSSSPRLARKCAMDALRPYIGKVDLIIFVNHYLTITNLKYFQRKFKNQLFLGLSLKQPSTSIKRKVIILTTKSVAKTINYHNYTFRLKRKSKTLILDSWVPKIDDGEFSDDDIKTTFKDICIPADGKSTELILACAHFSDIKPDLKKYFGRNIKIHDSFDDTIKKTCKILKIRGGTGKKTR